MKSRIDTGGLDAALSKLAFMPGTGDVGGPAAMGAAPMPADPSMMGAAPPPMDPMMGGPPGMMPPPGGGMPPMGGGPPPMMGGPSM